MTLSAGFDDRCTRSCGRPGDPSKKTRVRTRHIRGPGNRERSPHRQPRRLHGPPPNFHRCLITATMKVPWTCGSSGGAPGVHFVTGGDAIAFDERIRQPDERVLCDQQLEPGQLLDRRGARAPVRRPRARGPRLRGRARRRCPQVPLACPTASLEGHNNNLNGQGIGVDNIGVGAVNATNNWWGCA